jgi:hypothetical protein
MKALRKYFTMLASAAVVIAAAAISHAQTFTSIGKNYVIASVTTGGSKQVSIVSVALQGNAAQLSWTGATVGSGWLVANQYIQLVTNITETGGGVQIYTDNENSTPAFSPTAVSSNTPSPAGLVNNSNTTQSLPTAWTASTFTLTSVTPVDPTANSGSSYNWFLHEDKSQVANVLNAAQFTDGDPYITVYAAPNTTLTSGTTLDKNGNPVAGAATTVYGGGVHYAQAPTSFGNFNTNATTYIYTEANFASALAQTTYSTNKLILEAYTLQ